MYYFPNETRDTERIAWLRNPFEVDFSKTSIISKDESKLIELSCNRSLKSKLELAEFWLHISKKYIALSGRAVSVLLSYCHLRRHTPIYVESWFSDMTAIKTKYRNSLNVSDDLRLCLSQIKPRMDKFLSNTQSVISLICKVLN